LPPPGKRKIGANYQPDFGVLLGKEKVEWVVLRIAELGLQLDDYVLYVISE
jgi:hypothetical protein